MTKAFLDSAQGIPQTSPRDKSAALNAATGAILNAAKRFNRVLLGSHSTLRTILMNFSSQVILIDRQSTT